MFNSNLWFKNGNLKCNVLLVKWYETLTGLYLYEFKYTELGIQARECKWEVKKFTHALATRLLQYLSPLSLSIIIYFAEGLELDYL